MSKIRGGIGKIEIANNETFDTTSPNWAITIPATALPQEGNEVPEPAVETVQLADGRNVNVGYTVTFAIRVKEIAAADLQNLKDAEDQDTELWIRYSSADLASDGTTPKLVAVLKKVLLTRVTDLLLAARPGLSAAIIEGNTSGATLDDVMTTTVTT
ncbi:MAG: hypothetical protein KatS3mg051_1582 [Anaerolineae bacterium]|nr:MAG: hypothetical protein KatS3mg051_1582 [Anaerolineae bacterium]